VGPQGYSPDPTDGRLTGAKLLGQAMTAPMGRAVVGPMTGRLQKFNWYSVRLLSKTATTFALNETDETKAMKALLLQHPIDKAASPSDREINTTPESFMSEKDKSLFIEKHPDGYAILRGGVKKPLAVEATQEAAIEKARKLDPEVAIRVERVRNVEGGGRDKWRGI
jgi:hypothetical protein